MAAVSGLNGYMTIGSCIVASLTDCDLTLGSPNEEFFTVDGAGWSQTVATAKRGSGTINAVLDEAALISSVAESGELVTLTLFASTAGATATGSARLGQFNTTVNVEGTVEKVSIPFMTHGAWTGLLVT
jgi:hypothetical protein